jgi:hypothetical protein
MPIGRILIEGKILPAAASDVQAFLTVLAGGIIWQIPR